LAPNLVNMHSDLALAGAIACLVAALVASGWLALEVRHDIVRFNRLRRTAAPVYRIRED
jgi:hypothetical protein